MRKSSLHTRLFWYACLLGSSELLVRNINNFLNSFFELQKCENNFWSYFAAAKVLVLWVNEIWEYFWGYSLHIMYSI